MNHVRFLAPAALLASFFFAIPAYATVPPSLQLSATGSGDNVQISVTADPNASVLLSYIESGSGQQIVPLGNTDGNGTFTTTVSSASYGITSGMPVTAIIGGTSGPKSQTVDWPTVTSATSFTLSPSALVVNAGSSAAVTATNTGGSTLYVSGNSNPSVANVSISGSQITVSGNVAGSTTVTVCTVGSSSDCPSVSVIVQNSGSGTLSFSNNNVTVVSGQNLPVTVSGGSGSYYVASDSDSNVIQASLNGSVLTLSTGVTNGSASITVCSADQGACGVVNATAGNASSVSLSFSNAAPSLSTSQSATVYIYGPSGVSFYVSSNSNPSVVQANLTGNTLTLSGISSGSSQISVCASTGTCASLTATVTYAQTSANIGLSQNTLSLSPGQSATVAISGGTPPYSTTGGTGSVSQESISGTQMVVYGMNAGSSSVWVCSSGGGCTNLAVMVNGTGTGSTPFALGQSSVSLAIGGGATVTLSGNGSYYVQSNSAPTTASAVVSGSNLVVAGLSAGSASVTVCENGGGCGTLGVTVNGSVATSGGSSNASAPTTVFTEYLAPGSQDAQVTALQKLLLAEGYSIPAGATGYYGGQTVNAVVAFQAARGIDQLGVVGPATRAALNALEESGTSSGSSGSTTDISSMSLSQLEARVQSLEAQLTQVLNRIKQLTGG